MVNLREVLSAGCKPFAFIICRVAARGSIPPLPIMKSSRWLDKLVIEQIIDGDWRVGVICRDELNEYELRGESKPTLSEAFAHGQEIFKDYEHWEDWGYIVD